MKLEIKKINDPVETVKTEKDIYEISDDLGNIIPCDRWYEKSKNKYHIRFKINDRTFYKTESFFNEHQTNNILILEINENKESRTLSSTHTKKNNWTDKLTTDELNEYNEYMTQIKSIQDKIDELRERTKDRKSKSEIMSELGSHSMEELMAMIDNLKKVTK